ncbi:hypothetical protein VSH64_24780 [Amycolatopsis rhabdoformis]|uniref:Uncharacterized protein n=1 Tax=Amycolatopsis rhabdoformis TaxID=1448059 RepID=A0ABZ1HXI6_9PSEU|nr:hypothetical protein [Amycolatopsis rhabdoformis]WSE26093.1 hypothetical protein VSH64_24780 [Amycolatopsis rhabdoformis]
MTSMQMKQHDLEPALVLVAEDAAGMADFGQVGSWRILGKLAGELVVDGPPDTAVVDPENPARVTLTRAWVSGETAALGEMRIEAEAMWPGDRPQTFPPASYGTVRFYADLG